MKVTVLEFVEHRSDRLVVLRKRFADTRRQARVVDQVAQALARESQVIRAGVVPRLSYRRFFLPGPSWQRGERPLENIH